MRQLRCDWLAPHPVSSAPGAGSKKLLVQTTSWSHTNLRRIASTKIRRCWQVEVGSLPKSAPWLPGAGSKKL
ncbi:hypothetical protein E2C01_067478 [Portunus trituberculatus]|uniref:Uncharacterized protein n=1 Tax=Portunus trituberculatus TaxID=210409 RepID=A0A5B7HL41_PORTR|nr:hypothetical protein [Portunus trituberculatus]